MQKIKDLILKFLDNIIIQKLIIVLILAIPGFLWIIAGIITSKF